MGLWRIKKKLSPEEQVRENAEHGNANEKKFEFAGGMMNRGTKREPTGRDYDEKDEHWELKSEDWGGIDKTSPAKDKPNLSRKQKELQKKDPKNYKVQRTNRDTLTRPWNPPEEWMPEEDED